MNIAVLMKLVAGSGTDAFQEGSTVRSIENGIANPADILAFETAVFLQKNTDAKVSVFTMGPNRAASLLMEVCRLGAARLYHISDPSFAGSDTFVTAKILARALTRTGRFDIILCGERAVDGETGQVPGELSAMLDTGFTTGVVGIEKIESEHIVCRCRGTHSLDTVRLRTPCVLGISCGMQGVGHPLMPSLESLRLARQTKIVTLDRETLGFSREEVGQSGSPTRVKHARNVDWERKCAMLDDVDKAVSKTLELVRTMSEAGQERI